MSDEMADTEMVATGAHILLVEDDRDLSLILREILAFEGFRVTGAVDGSEALERLTQTPFDLVITDMMMPVMDGFELLRHLRANFPQTPVLALSAIPDYVRAAKREGATDSLMKPFNTDELVRRARGLYEKKPLSPAPVVSDGLAERERVAAVADVGPDAPDGLVRFTERAARVFEVPVCAVTTVSATREHWYASCGVPEKLKQKRGGRRDELACTHSVDGRSALVVQNVAEHPFLKFMPIRKQIDFAFYAGAPVFSKEGHALGTLCVLDYQPRRFGHFDLELLKVLATRVGGELEWQSHLTAALEPASSYQYLSRYDPELGLLGREAFTEALEVQSLRSVISRVALTLVVLRLDDHSSVSVLEDAFESDLFGRLQKDRIGLLAFGQDAATVGAKLQAAAPGIVWTALDVSRQVGAGTSALRDAEVELAQQLAEEAGSRHAPH